MADFTPNYNLKKPLRTEYYNVADANGNSDIVDAQLKAVNDKVDLVEGEVDALELGKVDKVVGQGLSDENYTLIEKNKVANLPDDTNAQLAEIEQKQGLLSNLLTTAKTSLVAAINELFSSKANKAQETWILPTLANGWINVVNQTTRYKKTSSGIVICEIYVRNGTAGSYIFQLPIGYRPSQILHFTGLSTAVLAGVYIDTIGQVFYNFGTTTNNNRFQIMFQTEG